MRRIDWALLLTIQCMIHKRPIKGAVRALAAVAITGRLSTRERAFERHDVGLLAGAGPVRCADPPA